MPQATVEQLYVLNLLNDALEGAGGQEIDTRLKRELGDRWHFVPEMANLEKLGWVKRKGGSPLTGPQDLIHQHYVLTSEGLAAFGQAISRLEEAAQRNVDDVHTGPIRRIGHKVLDLCHRYLDRIADKVNKKIAQYHETPNKGWYDIRTLASVILIPLALVSLVLVRPKNQNSIPSQPIPLEQIEPAATPAPVKPIPTTPAPITPPPSKPVPQTPAPKPENQEKSEPSPKNKQKHHLNDGGVRMLASWEARTSGDRTGRVLGNNGSSS